MLETVEDEDEPSEDEDAEDVLRVRLRRLPPETWPCSVSNTAFKIMPITGTVMALPIPLFNSRSVSSWGALKARSLEASNVLPRAILEKSVRATLRALGFSSSTSATRYLAQLLSNTSHAWC